MILGKKHRLTPPGISLRYGVGISIILGDSGFKYHYYRGYSGIPLGNYCLTPLRAKKFGGYSVILGKKHCLTPPGIS